MRNKANIHAKQSNDFQNRIDDSRVTYGRFACNVWTIRV